MTSTHSSRSALGAHASRFERTGASLAFDDPRHLQAYRWLVDEAWLLDTQDYTGWLETLTEDIHYLMPVRVSTALGAVGTLLQNNYHWSNFATSYWLDTIAFGAEYRRDSFNQVPDDIRRRGDLAGFFAGCARSQARR